MAMPMMAMTSARIGQRCRRVRAGAAPGRRVAGCIMLRGDSPCRMTSPRLPNAAFQGRDVPGL
jgi:hypothetical protein